MFPVSLAAYLALIVLLTTILHTTENRSVILSRFSSYVLAKQDCLLASSVRRELRSFIPITTLL
jgi:hypothetical protein